MLNPPEALDWYEDDDLDEDDLPDDLLFDDSLAYEG